MARVLVQGVPFLVGDAAIRRYTGPHDIRWMCGLPDAPEQGYSVRYDINRHDIHAVLASLDKWQPDLLLFFQPEDQTPPTGIEHCGVRTVGFGADWSHTFPRLLGSLGLFDIAATDYPGAAEADWRGFCHPQYLSPFCSYQPELNRNRNLPRDIDLLYVGSMNHALRPERGILLPRMEALSNRFNVVITTGVYGEAYAQLLNRAKLVFNYSARGELNLRFFETLACGAIPMLESANAEVHQEFQDGEEVCLFDLEDFEERIEEVLANPARCESMRQRAAARARAFAPEALLNRVIDAALAAPSSGRPLLSHTSQERAYHDAMLHSGSCYPAVRAASLQKIRAYAQQYPEDPRAWTLIARHVLTPKFHLYMLCDHEDALKAPARQALEKAAQLAPDDAVHLANAAWCAHWCGDAAAEVIYATRAGAATRAEYPELLIGSVEDPAWARFMLDFARGVSGSALLKLLRSTLSEQAC